MRYTIKNEISGEIIVCDYTDEVDSIIESSLYEGPVQLYKREDFTVDKQMQCRGKDCHKYDDGSLGIQERFDAYGITTGYYCESCYNNNYPYRKDKYPTMENDGYGEQLSDDY